MSTMQREFMRFDTRQDRPRFVIDRFAPYLTGGVLDVGCDEAPLRELVGRERYLGIDRSPEADLHLDLQACERLPFDDGEWDTVLCLDVLEHLDNLHRIFEEILRVARHHAVIGLPNNWNSARKRIGRGHGSIAHYGLPLDPPPDRHRWFFSLEEARTFFLGQAERHGVRVRELVVIEKPRPPLVRGLRRLLCGELDRYLNLYAHSLICVLEKG
jgi:SAM-dependent methyltransferase